MNSGETIKTQMKMKIICTDNWGWIPDFLINNNLVMCGLGFVVFKESPLVSEQFTFGKMFIAIIKWEIS